MSILRLADKDTPGLFGSVEVPIVGGRHHGRFVLVHNHTADIKAENFIEGEYYSPRWKGTRCVALHPRRWFKIGIETALAMLETHGPLLQNWPAIDAIGGAAHGYGQHVRNLEAKGTGYWLGGREADEYGNSRFVTQRYRLWRAESGTFYLVPHDWPEAEIAVRATAAKITGRAA